MICPRCGDRGALTHYRIQMPGGGFAPLAEMEEAHAIEVAEIVSGSVVRSIFCPVEQAWYP